MGVGIKLENFTKQKRGKSGSLVTLPVRFTATAPFDRLYTLLKRLASNPTRSLTFKKLTLSRASKPASTFTRPANPKNPIKLDAEIALHFLPSQPKRDIEDSSNTPISNGKWNRIRGVFWVFSNGQMSNARDPLESRLHTLVEQPRPSAGGSSGGFLTKFPAKKYIVMGVKSDGEGGGHALVCNPTNDSECTRVTLDTKIGNNGGMVIEIRTKAIVIDEPSPPKEIVLKRSF